jgi:uncharacterized membrane protein
MILLYKKIKNFFFGADNKRRPNATKYIFGATSCIITSLALIIGLNNSSNAKFSIIGSLLVIALADNISDMLGIHIYQETEGLIMRDVWLSSFTNFFTRLFVSLGFIAIVIAFPAKVAMTVSLVYGLSALIIFIAVAVILASKYLGQIIINKFHYF